MTIAKVDTGFSGALQAGTQPMARNLRGGRN